MKSIQHTLLNGCLKGDSDAQFRLYNLYKSKFYGLCLRYAKRRADADDMLQEGFIKIFRDIGQFSGKGSLEAWMSKVIVNTCLMFLRKDKRNLITHIQPELLNDVAITNGDLLSSLEIDEILSLFSEMPDGYRAVLNLYVLEDYSHKEIAEMLEININTSKSQLSRARIYFGKLMAKRSLLKNEMYGT